MILSGKSTLSPSGPAHGPERSAALARRLVWVLGAMSAFSPLAVDMYLPAFPEIAADLGTSTAAVQTTLAIFLLGLGVGQILWGSLSDRVGRRVPLVAGCALFALMGGICALTPSITALLVARLVMGLSGAAGMVVSRAVVRDLFEEKEAARFYSMMMIVGGIAPIVAPYLGGLLLTYCHWRVIFVVIAAFGGLCALAAAVVVPETLAPAVRQTGSVRTLLGGYWRILSDRRFAVPALTLGLTSAILFSYIANSSYIFIEVFGLPVASFALLFATNSVGLYLGAVSNRLLLRRFTARRLLRGGLALTSVSALLLVGCAASGVGGPALFFAVLFLCLATLGTIFPNATAMTMQPFAAQAGSASALLGITQFVLGAVGGAAASAFHDGSVLPMAAQIALCAVAAQLVLGMGAGGKERPLERDEAGMNR